MSPLWYLWWMFLSNLTYEAELRYKEGQIIKLFEKAGLDINYLGIEGVP